MQQRKKGILNDLKDRQKVEDELVELKVTNFTSNKIDKASPNKESKSILAPLLIPYNSGIITNKNKNTENTIEQPSFEKIKFKMRRRSNKSPLKSVNKLEKLRK